LTRTNDHYLGAFWKSLAFDNPRLVFHFRYDNYDVPDTMNVHGIYDTSATMHTFESRGEFQSYLQQEAGVSGSYFGFYAGAKKAWGSSVSAAQQQYMSVLDVDVDR